MRLLLDTHALIWWLAGDTALSAAARDAIADPENQAVVSAVSAMEISTKYRLGKLDDVGPLVQDFEGTLARHGFLELPITVRHGRLAGSLQVPHKDPFDRLLIAQSLVEPMPLVSNEALFDSFGVSRIW